MKKLKLLLSISVMCLSFVVLCFGVFSAMSVTYTIGGKIFYEVTDVMVQIETRVYRSIAKTVINADELATKVQNDFEGKTFTEIETNSNYSVAKNDIAVFTSTAEMTDDQAQGVATGIEINYNNGYQYYIVVNIKSLTSSRKAYAKIDSGVINDENSYMYVTSYQNDIIKPTSGDNTGKNIVLACGLKDPKASIDSVDFSYSIIVEYGAYVPSVEGSVEGSTYEILDETAKTARLAYSGGKNGDSIPEYVTFDYLKKTFTASEIMSGSDLLLKLCLYKPFVCTYTNTSGTEVTEKFLTYSAALTKFQSGSVDTTKNITIDHSSVTLTKDDLTTDTEEINGNSLAKMEKNYGVQIMCYVTITRGESSCVEGWPGWLSMVFALYRMFKEDNVIDEVIIKLTKTRIPESGDEYYKVTELGECAFRNGDLASGGCSSVTIPKSVTTICPYAFYNESGGGEDLGYDNRTVSFESTSGWFVTKDKDATSGIDIDVTDSTTNGKNLMGTYLDYYWKKK